MDRINRKIVKKPACLVDNEQKWTDDYKLKKQANSKLNLEEQGHP